MNKDSLHKAIINALLDVHESAVGAVTRANDTATHEENVAENKYDTLGLEASYLAHGQSQRLAECESDLVKFRKLPVTEFTENTTIALGALVTLEDEQAQQKQLFLGSVAGGLKLHFKGHDIMLITTSAPLGKALLGHFVGDEIVVLVGAQKIRYEIIAVQ